jgi:hypothetical protein
LRDSSSLLTSLPQSPTTHIGATEEAESSVWLLATPVTVALTCQLTS